jgi:vacuolar-type H+-ATPase subunit I/STV1
MKAPLVRTLYVVSALVLVVTGFGQMPIYKRYYVSSLPGLHWLADFYVTHWLHYLSAAVLMGLVVYTLVIFFFAYNRTKKISISGFVRGLIILCLIVTGILLVINNLPGSIFSQGAIIFLDIAHMALAMLFLFAGLVAIIRKSPWVVERVDR